MGVDKEPSGRRSVRVEIEVPGTPEDVWQAIATGPGVSSWFVPTEERKDGTVVSHFGPGMDAVATRTAWDPPRRFAAESQGFGPGAPPLATEWIVEARSGGTCVVRVVHSLFASSDEWDDQLESFESGWPTWFTILRLYLAHFRGQPCAAFQVLGFAPEPDVAAWDALTGALGLSGAAEGQTLTSPPGPPPLAGLVEQVGTGRHLHAIVRLVEPSPGIAMLFAHAMGGQVCLAVKLYLYGDEAVATAARQEPSWTAWMSARFPAAVVGGPCA
jgi:hypothetical protein